MDIMTLFSSSVCHPSLLTRVIDGNKCSHGIANALKISKFCIVDTTSKVSRAFSQPKLSPSFPQANSLFELGRRDVYSANRFDLINLIKESSHRSISVRSTFPGIRNLPPVSGPKTL
jgi:hypothetical protein